MAFGGGPAAAQPPPFCFWVESYFLLFRKSRPLGLAGVLPSARPEEPGSPGRERGVAGKVGAGSRPPVLVVRSAPHPRSERTRGYTFLSPFRPSWVSAGPPKKHGDTLPPLALPWPLARALVAHQKLGDAWGASPLTEVSGKPRKPSHVTCKVLLTCALHHLFSVSPIAQPTCCPGGEKVTPTLTHTPKGA